MNEYKPDWEVPVETENPIINNRIVNDRTFAARLKFFLMKVEPQDLPGIEEKEYLIEVANKLLKWQKVTAMTKSEKEYLKNIDFI